MSNFGFVRVSSDVSVSHTDDLTYSKLKKQRDYLKAKHMYQNYTKKMILKYYTNTHIYIIF
jgi:hypothetical protein